MSLHWIVALAAILPLWLLQNVIHELAHGLTMYIGWKWKFKIYPFPSKRLGRFTFAHVVYSPGPKSSDPDNRGRALVSIMPKIVNLLFMFVSWITIIILGGISPITTVVLGLFALFNFIDFAVGVMAIFGSNKKSDIYRFKSYMNLSNKEIRIFSVSLMILTCLMTVLLIGRSVVLFLL